MRRSCSGLIVRAMVLLMFAAPVRAGPAGSEAAETPPQPPPPPPPPAAEWVAPVAERVPSQAQPAVPLDEVFSAEEIARLKGILKEDESCERLERSRVKARFYGFIEADLAYDSHTTSDGDFARWVESETLSREDDQFSVTARATRLGVELTGPNRCGLELDGRIEIDFYGGGSDFAEWLKLRHAYVRLYWPRHRFAILGGQTWDTNVPLNMPTINYTVGWWAGNLGFRRPQLRLTKGFALGPCSELQLELAAARTITGRSSPFTAPERDTGEDEGHPSAQGRLSVSTERAWGEEAVLGLSGHFGREEWDRDGFGRYEEFDTWSLALDLSLPLTPRLHLSGEAWLGSNLNSYFGGIGQGLNTTVVGAERPIDSHGGWLALRWQPVTCWRFATGAAFDDPKNEDLSAGMRSFNTTAFVNAWYQVREPLLIGVEFSYWHTEYVALRRGNSLRVQTAIRYDF